MKRSLRALVVSVVVIVATLPVPVMFVLGAMGEARETTSANAAREAVEELVTELSAPRRPQDVVRETAERHRVLVRLEPIVDGAPELGADHDLRVATYAGVASIVVDPDATPDDDDTPVRERPVARSAAAGRRATACVTRNGGGLLVCESAARTSDGRWVAFARRSARSDAQRLFETRRPLAALTAFVLLSGLALAWWLVTRVVRPLDSLRSALAKRATDARTATDPIVLDAPPEVAEVITAHNRVLGALAEERSSKAALADELVHEIKSPLAAVRIAIEQLESAPPSARAELATRAIDAIKSVDRTIGAMLELSRAEAGLAHEPRERCDVRALVEGACTTTATRAGVTLSVSQGEAAYATVAVSSVTRAIRCLLDNAVSFARSDVTVTVARDATHVVVTVRDDGEGIEPAIVDKVFERFFSARRDSGGSGVGLALVRAVAAAHHGSATVESVVGEHATFTFRVLA